MDNEMVRLLEDYVDRKICKVSDLTQCNGCTEKAYCDALEPNVEAYLRARYYKPAGTKSTPEKPVIKPDNVNHPSHYETGRFECIDVMTETQGRDAVYEFCVCNAFKYLYRHRRKNNAEDIKKAIWYLNKALELSGEDK